MALSVAWLGLNPITAAEYRLTLQATPERLLADGSSAAQITVEVKDSAGNPAPDGTEVRFTTTAGTIVSSADTAGGTATALLTGAPYPTLAVVTAQVGADHGITQVEFFSGETEDATSPLLQLEGDLEYSVDQQLILGTGGVTVQYRGLTITAENAQIDQFQGMIKAQGNVTLTQGQNQLTGDELAYDSQTQRGVLLEIGDTLKKTAFQGRNLTPYGTRVSPQQDETAPLIPGDSRLWITARRMTVVPREKIQFRQASIYVNDVCLMSFPHYFLSLTGGSNFLQQQIRYTSESGFVLDMPFYYRLTPQQTSAVKVRYASKGSSYSSYYSPRHGWSLGLEEQYSLGSRAEGRVFLDSVTHRERSLEWNHQHEFDRRTRGNLSLTYQPRSTYAQNQLNGYLSLYQSLPRANLSFSANGSRSETPGYGGSSSHTYRNFSANLRYTQRTRPIPGTNVGYGTGLTLGYGRAMTSYFPLYRSTGRQFSSQRDDPTWYQTLALGL